MHMHFDAAAILSEAENEAQFEDDDAAIRANMEALCAALNEGPRFADSAADQIAQGLIARQVDRIAGLKWSADFPEIADEKVEAPVFLTGLPRSGTTYFQYLFDNDRRFRLIRTWEAVMPLPPPCHDPASVEQRKAIEREYNEQLRFKVENFDALHLIDEDGPQECHVFMEQACAAAGFHNLYDVPGFFDYLVTGCDLQAAYRVHRRQLQLLQWQCPETRWALKYPNHTLAMDAILAVYPDAHFVMTHRDPVQVVASIAKMSYSLRAARYAEPVDPYHVGRQMLAFIRTHIDRLMAFCSGPHGDRVTHVDYYRLADDPAAMLGDIHRGIGIDTPGDVRAQIAVWREANPKGARGKNEYGLAQFGIDEAEARALFADYAQHFDIPTEAEAVQG